MNRNIRRRLGVFVSSGILATGLVLAAGGTAFASNDGGVGGNGGNGGAGGNGGGSWVGTNGCDPFFCNYPAGIASCSPVVTWCGATRGWDLARWLGCPVFPGQLLNGLFQHSANCQSRCVG